MTAFSEIKTGYGGAEIAAAAISTTRTLLNGLMIKAAAGNSDIVYVGKIHVTILTGFELSAGDELFIAIDDPAKVYVVADPSQNEQQTVTYNSGAANETFKLSFGGQTTTAIAYDAAAATVETAFELLSTVGAGNGTFTGSAGGPWTIEFTGDFAGTDQALVTASDVGVDEIQTITYSGNAATDTYTLTWDAKETSVLNIDDNNATILAALVALDGIESGDVVLSGGAAPGTPVVVTFAGNLDLTDIGAITGVGGTNEIQTVTLTSTQAGDVFYITYDGQTTTDIPFGALTTTVQAALEALSNVTAGDILVTGGTGGPWTLTFDQLLANTNVSEVTGDAGRDEVQTLTLGSTVAGDTFDITYSAATTTPIPYDASAATVEAALEVLGGISAGDVVVSGSAGGPYTLSFDETLGFTDLAEVTAIAGTHEVQTLTLSGTIAGDTFAITWGGETTTDIAYDAAAGTVQAALEVFSGIDTNDCVVTGSAGGPYTLTFGELLGYAPQAEVTAVGGTDEIQTITLASTIAGDSFYITYAGQTTTDIAYDAAAATVQSALEVLSNVTAGDILVTGSAGGPWTLTFDQLLANTNVDQVTGDAGTDEIQTITLGSTVAGDTFDITYSGQTTTMIDYMASAETVQAALEVLSNITAGDVVVSGSAGGPYTLTFDTLLGFTDLSEVTGTAGTNEVQSVTIDADVIGGTYTLTWGGNTTGNIDFDASTTDVKDALEALAGIAVDDLAVTGTAPAWEVEFVVNLKQQPISPITGSGALLSGRTVDITETVTGVVAVDEVQTVSIPSDTTGGSFTLTYDGQTTGAIQFNDTFGTLDGLLEALSNIGAGDVVVSGGPGPDTDWVVTFETLLAATDVDLMTADGALLTGSDVTVIETQSGGGGNNEIQTVSIPAEVVGGTFTLTYNGQTTSTIAYNAAAGVVQASLVALTNIGASDMSVTGTAPTWVCEFQGNLANTEVVQMSGNGTLLAGKTVTVIETIKGVTAVNETQTINIPNDSVGGSFTLSFSGQGPTGAITYDDVAADIKTELELLSNIDTVAVTGGAGPGTDWVVEFQGTNAATDVALMTADSTLLLGGTPVIAEETPGNAATFTPATPTPGNAATFTPATPTPGNEATVTPATSTEGHTATITPATIIAGHAATFTPATTVAGNELTISVVETQKGVTKTVTIVETVEASAESKYSWIGQ